MPRKLTKSVTLTPSAGRRLVITGHPVVVVLLDEIETHLEAARAAHKAGDHLKYMEHVRKLLTAGNKARRVGRPELPPGMHVDEQVEQIVETRGIEAAKAETGLSETSIDRYLRRARSRRTQHQQVRTKIR